MRLLVAEDDPTMRRFLAQGLEEAGYAVDAFASGEDARDAGRVVTYDVAILDINLPDLDGFALCRDLQRGDSPPAVLFLTARDGVADRVAGLDLGAGDYLVKPFAFPELLARVRALLRRQPVSQPHLEAGDLRLDPASRRVTYGGTEIPLSAKEYALLEFLLRNVGRVMSRDAITEHVWNFDLDAESNFLQVLVYAVRRKLEAAGLPDPIRTVRGVGYVIDLPAA
ncbi:MAG: response regulator transcription factor [Thermomicrobiales bacterium]